MAKLSARIQMSRWRAAHPERARELTRESVYRWRDANLDIARERVRDYDARHPEEKRQSNRRYRARKRGLMGIVSPNIVELLWEKQSGECNNLFCLADLVFEIRMYHLDHIMPLALGGLHDDNNLQLLCASCNMHKHAKHPKDFIL